MEVVGHVFPFKTNSYIVNELINWENVPNDPIFTLTFSHEKMLRSAHFEQMKTVLGNGHNPQKIKYLSNKIRMKLNPHPAGQTDLNVPSLNGKELKGIQHKYNETVLFFPSQGQTCHAFCSFCFRWPQFVNENGLKFSTKESSLLVDYIRNHPEITDILFTGGDPLIMTAGSLAEYINTLLKADLSNLHTIRIGTKSLSYWPYRFLTDSDADDLLALFKKITNAGKHLAIMANFNHPREMKTNAVKEAISRVLETGAQIRTQSPLAAHINDQPEIWTEMWNKQVKLGCIPYYMFVARNTGAQHYFGVPLAEALNIFRTAYKGVSGLARTVRGPVMSCTPGKVQVLGVNEINGEKVFVLQLLQGRDPDWVKRPFFAKYDEKAMWFNDLKPAFGDNKFFFEKNTNDMFFTYADLQKELCDDSFTLR